MGGRNQQQPQREDPGSAMVPAQQGGAVQTRAQADAAAFTRVQGMLDKRRDQLAELLGESVSVDRWLTVTLAAFQTTPALLSCSELSILTGIRQAAQYGLEIGGPLSDSSLIPEKGEARLQIEYRGLRKLALRAPDVVKVDAGLVFERDDFDYQEGDDPRIHHKPFLDGDRGKRRGAYAFAKLRSGEIIPAWLSIAELDQRRNVSRSFRAGSGPWIQWPDMMYRKTMLAHLIRSKLVLDPIVREAVLQADDTDPRLAGTAITATVASTPQSRLRRRLQGGGESLPELAAGGSGGQEGEQGAQPAAEAAPAAQGPDSGQQGDQEREPTKPANPETGETLESEAAAAAKPVGDLPEGWDPKLCGRLSIYGDGGRCGKPVDHLAGKGAGAQVHASGFATWEEGQQA